MKLLSWNVNGIRAVLKKGFLDFLESEQPDIICLQEHKASPEVVPVEWSSEYSAYWSVAQRKGYSGTVILTKPKPVAVTYGLGIAEHDTEGRVVTAEYPEFFVVNAYVPNSKRELTRLEYRQQWDRDLLTYLKGLEARKPVIFCGDLNVAHTELDLARPKQNVKTHGFTPEERAGFSAMVEAGFIDTFREFEPGPGHYSWWSQMSDARARNLGWRIDYFLVSGGLRPRLKSAFIRPKITGSDHCPVGIEIL
jgi:exodeoxyribonuclease III